MGLQVKQDTFKLILWFILEQIKSVKVVVAISKEIIVKDRLFFVIVVKFINSITMQFTDKILYTVVHHNAPYILAFFFLISNGVFLQKLHY